MTITPLDQSIIEKAIKMVFGTEEKVLVKKDKTTHEVTSVSYNSKTPITRENLEVIMTSKVPFLIYRSGTGMTVNFTYKDKI